MQERVVICGGPKAGKTTLAKRYSASVLCCDDYIYLGWSKASEVIADWMVANPGPWVVEGVAAVRALRKALYVAPRPCDRVIWLGATNVRQNDKQAATGKGCETVMNQLRPLLRSRGIAIEG